MRRRFLAAPALVPAAILAMFQMAAVSQAKPGFKLIHVLDVDYGSCCLALADCLRQVASWSKAHPRHLPIVITLKTNDTKTPMPGATKPIVCDETAMNALEDEIRTVFAPG